VFVSACAGVPGLGGAGVATGAGVIPLEFKFTPSKVVSGDKALLSLTVQNLGSVEAKNVNVFLFGLPTDWREDGAPYRTFQTPFNLEPPRTDTKVPGEKNTLTWILTAPQYLPQKIPFSYTASARICYPYKTTASGSIELLSEQEFVSLQREGRISEKPVAVKTTSAPLSIRIDSTQPLLWRADKNVTFRVTINNVGGGTVLSPSLDCAIFKTGFSGQANITELNKLNFKIEGSGFNCDITGGPLFLERGKSQSFSVRCPIGDMPVTPRLEKQIELTLDYNYYIDTSTTVTVEGLDVTQAPPPTATAPSAPATPTAAASPAPTSTTTTTTTTTTTPPTPAPTPTSGPCTTLGDFRCNGNKLEICREVSGANQWSLWSDCSAVSKTCDAAARLCK